MSISPFKALLPLHGIGVTLEFTDPAEFTFFHQMSVDAFNRFMLGSPADYKNCITSEAPESGRLNYTLGDKYRYSILSYGGKKHHLQLLISRLLGLPHTAPITDAGVPLRNNTKLVQLNDLIDGKPLVNSQGITPFTAKHLIELAHQWQNEHTTYPRTLHFQLLSPTRLMRSSEARNSLKLTGENRFCRDQTQLTPALLVQRIIESLNNLITEQGQETLAIEAHIYEGLPLSVKQADLFWLDTPYYSKDEADNTAGGVVGYITLEQTAPIPHGIWQGLILGQYLGIGQRRVSGFGKYQLSLTPAPSSQLLPIRFGRSQTLMSQMTQNSIIEKAIILSELPEEPTEKQRAQLKSAIGQLNKGNHHLTMPLIKAALKAQIPIHISNRMGEYEGAIWRRQPIDNSYKHWFIQLQHFDNEDAALILAKATVESRLHNMQFTLQRYHKNPAVLTALKRIAALKHKVEACQQLPSLLGVEGSATKAYYEGLQALVPDWCNFTGRNRRPPKDPYNVLLSFGYTWLYAHCDAILTSLGFLTWKGFYHQTSSGHAALASDIIESYRHIVERAALTAVNTKQIQLDDFRIEDNQLRLSSKARKAYITLLEKRFLKTDEQGHTLWQTLHQQGKALLKNINNHTPYSPYKEGN